MKNLLKILGITGVLLTGGTTLNALAQKREKTINNDKPYLENTISGVGYSDHQSNKTFKVEEQSLFGIYNVNDVPRIFVANNNQDDGELSMNVYPIDQAEIQDVYQGKTSINGLVSYIPTRLANESTHEIIKNFQLTEFNGKLKKAIDKSKIKSRNSFGFSVDVTDEDFDLKLPSFTLPNGEVYVAISTDWGNFYDDKGDYQYINFPESTLSEFYIKLIEGKFITFTNLGTGEVNLRSEDGFYIPAREEIQLNADSYQEPIKQSSPQPNDLEKKAITGQSPTKYISNTSTQTQDTAVYHIIEKGDTFYNLADKYWNNEKEADEIQKLNPNVDPTKLQIGQKIRVK